MEYIVTLFAFVIVVMITSMRNKFSSQLDLLNNKLDSLSSELKKIKIKEASPEVQEKKSIFETTIQHKTPVITPEVKVEKEAEKIISQQEPKPEEIKKTFEPKVFTPAPPPSPPVPPKPPKPGFFERNPDLEKFIGENLANKIGIGILVLGIGFFVKYAIDQEWINEIGRVFIGILCGGGLLGVAHFLRKKFAPFSSVLVGGGIAVLYLTIAIAFHEYQLFSQTAAFIVMLFITGFAVALSIGYNRIELAILSILGGFASPFMVSTGEGNYTILFTYILILDVGMLVLAYYKKWNLVTIISYVFTILLFGSWLSARFESDNVSMIRGAMIFATLFYIVFFMMNIINNVKERTAFKSLEFSLLLSNSFLFYGAGIAILNNEYGEDFKGLFTAIIGVFNFIFAYTLYKNNRVDKNLIFLLIGLVLTFVSLAAPVQLEGNYITLFWAAEAALLFWLSQKSGIRLMKLASVVIMALMVISLVMDWDQLYFQYTESALPIILNKGYITGIFALASIVATLFFLKNERTENAEYVKLYKGILIFAGVAILYTSQLLELRHQLYFSGLAFEHCTVIIGCYNVLFVLGLLLSEEKLADENFKKLFAFSGIFVMFTYLAFYHRYVTISRDYYIFDNASGIGFAFHYLLVALLLIVTILSLPKIRNMKAFNDKTYHAYAWVYVFFFVFMASAELDHTVLLLANVTAETQAHVLLQNSKIGYPILWGITSFVLIAVGLKQKKKSLRIISLTLFLVTLLKLFLIDIRGISEGGKIAAFISLGLLLLIVSFMYQRLKKILLSDDATDASQQKEEVV